ncbi:MAG: NIPSNAP family protein [bacterium]
MKTSLIIPVAFFAGAIGGGFAVNALPAHAASPVSAPTLPAHNADRVFEIRTYTVAPGQLPLLNRRFRDNTVRIFARHGMESVGYWTPLDSATSQTTLVYVIAHPSREAARKAWSEFSADPEWVQVRKASEAEGLKVLKAESMFVAPTDYSPIK